MYIYMEVTILSLNSFFLTCFISYFFPVQYLQFIPLIDTDLPQMELTGLLLLTLKEHNIAKAHSTEDTNFSFHQAGL